MIAIIDYKAGNSPSVLHATRRLGLDAMLTCRASDVERATHIILPGVGNAEATLDSLRESGLLGAIENAVLRKKVPYLGICVGLQILYEYSEEGGAKCLGWLEGRVVRFDDRRLRVPQMGWNKVEFLKETSVKTQDDYFYFVNSYHAEPKDASDIWGIADYGNGFAACINKGNIFAAQFHVEKSGEAGLALLRNFCNLEL